MSLFDPYNLYQRKYKKTHKGQIIRQKPTNYQPPIVESEIPRSRLVLKSFGYSIYPPHYLFGENFSIPFTFIETGLEQTSLNLTVNYLWPLLQAKYSSLSDFIENNLSYNTSSIGIDIISATFIFGICDVHVKFYTNNGSNLVHNQFANLNSNSEKDSSLTYVPRGSATVFLCYDEGLPPNTGEGQTVFQNRTPYSHPEVLSYNHFDADWIEINSLSGLESDINLINLSFNNETSILKSYYISGNISIKLNPQ